MARWLIYGGLALVGIGLMMLALGKFGIHLGRLPGDVHIEGERGSFHFPIVTCILLSVVGSLILRWLGK